MSMTTPTLKPGDRFEMTVRGEVKDITARGGAFVLLEGSRMLTSEFSPSEIAAARITILEPELRVGRARDVASGEVGAVVAISGPWAWFVPDGTCGFPGTYPTKALRNIDGDDR